MRRACRVALESWARSQFCGRMTFLSKDNLCMPTIVHLLYLCTFPPNTLIPMLSHQADGEGRKALRKASRQKSGPELTEEEVMEAERQRMQVWQVLHI